jgi:hypothetical protein
MAELIESGGLPIGVEARLFALQKLVGGSHGIYYRNRELWQPVDLASATQKECRFEEEECPTDHLIDHFDRLEVPPTSEKDPLERIERKSMQIGLTDVVYEVMLQWQIDENQSKSSTLIPPFRSQLTPQISPSLPKGRPRIDQRPPIPWPKWAETDHSSRIDPNQLDAYGSQRQTPANRHTSGEVLGMYKSLLASFKVQFFRSVGILFDSTLTRQIETCQIICCNAVTLLRSTQIPK